VGKTGEKIRNLSGKTEEYTNGMRSEGGVSSVQERESDRGKGKGVRRMKGEGIRWSPGEIKFVQESFVGTGGRGKSRKGER